MAFVSLIFTALRLKRLQNVLIEEKLEAIKIHRKESPKAKFRFRHIGIDVRIAVKKCCSKIFQCSEKSRIHQFCFKLWHEGSCENFTIKSLFGFLGGILLTYLLYIFFIFQLNIKLTSATIVCAMLGCILTVGLAFSSKIRCIVLLTLPQFFSKRGRQALLAYAFVLALTGPAQNTLNNMGILSESLACGQEQLKQAVKQIIDVIKKPFITIKEAIKKVVKTVKEVIKKIKEVLLKIKRIIMALVRVVKSVFEFLGKIINICNKELGTPFERCSRVFENAIADCNAKLGPLFSWLCSLAYIVKAVCYIVKIFDYVCMLVNFISDSVVGVVLKKVKNFIRHIKTMFYVRIKFSHSFKYESTSSKNLKTIAKEIMAEIKDRSRGIVAFFNFMTSAVMLFFLYLVFQVTFYRIRYLTSERFDNIYITKYFRQIDQRRAKLGRETVLPLTKKEKTIYVPIAAVSLAKTERRKLSKSAVSLATASVKLAIHMIADYCLYWILTMITYHARYQSKIQAPNFPVAHISGEGFIAKLLRVIVNAFQPVGIQLEIDTVPCLPIPIPPDYDRYVQIGVTLLFCWVLTILEPYGLRFRNYIMGYYHPLRAKQRTIWLYNHILRSRSSFLLVARRLLRRKFGKGGGDNISCKELLRSKIRCGIFRICLGDDLQKTCLLCGEVFHENDRKKFVKCQTPQCPGLFCLECFESLKNICPICLSPIEYGDLDELDEEKDSSGDDQPPKKPKKDKKWSLFPCRKSPKDDDEPLIEESDEETKKDKVSKEEKEPESDSSTDYSYNYQYDKIEQSTLPKSSRFKDVEKQDIPDYESMESFRDEDIININLENIIRIPKNRQVQVELDITGIPSNDVVSQRRDLTDSVCRCSSSPKSVRQVEFIGVPNKNEKPKRNFRNKVKIIPSSLSECICSDLEVLEHFEETSFITVPKSTMSTSTRSDCKYCKAPKSNIISTLDIGFETEEELQNLVPKLDLSFLGGERKQRCTDRFASVTYEETCESPTSSITHRTLESSSVLSSLQNSPTNTEYKSLLRKRPVKDQHEDSRQPGEIRKKSYFHGGFSTEMDSPSSMDSYEFNKIQSKKIKQYYDATKKLCSDNRCQYSQKKKSFTDVFKKLLPKRNKKTSFLPLHRKDLSEVDEEQSYNYTAENWDDLDLDTDSPTYPFGSQTSSDTSEDHPLLGGSRIRGGECTHTNNCKLKGKACTHRKKRQISSKNQILLKDFATLSLPPKPKPVNVIDLLSRHFLSIEDLTPTKDPGFSMTTFDSFPNSNYTNSGLKENNSDFILSKAAATKLTLAEDATPASSESGLSEDICHALFGETCPKGIGKETGYLMQVGGEEQETDTPNIDSPISDIPQAITSENKRSSLEIRKTALSKNSLNQDQKKESTQLLSRLSESETIEDQHNSKEILEGNVFSSKLQRDSSQQSQLNNSQLYQLSQTEVNKPKKQSNLTLDHLLYKDEKTEITLLKDSKTSFKGNISSQLRRTPTKPSLKLQISLHNTLIQEDPPLLETPFEEHQNLSAERYKALAEMDSLRSRDKIIETTDSFPFAPTWTPSPLPQTNGQSGRIVLASDKIQQTSDNDFYQSSVNGEGTKDASRPCFCPPSAGDSFKTIHTRDGRVLLPNQQYSTSGSYYSYEIPEKDSNNAGQCKCCECYPRFSNYEQKYDERIMLHGNRKQYVDYSTNESMCSCCQCAKLQVEATFKKDLYRPPSPPPFAKSEPQYGKTGLKQDSPRIIPPHRRKSYPQAPRRHSYSNNKSSFHDDCECYCKPKYNPQRHSPSRFNTRYHQSTNNELNTADEAESNNLDTSNSMTDLPYQNNEDYLELVEELQDTLHIRNRNRVKKAMQEFETRSKQNQPLEKPIIDYDETSESEEPIIKRISELKNAKRTCCAGDKCTCYDQRDFPRYPRAKERTRKETVNSMNRPSHWTMDPSSGEWFKGCKCVNFRGTKNRNYPDQNQCSCCATRYQ